MAERVDSDTTVSGGLTSIIATLFFISGCAALIYEVVWFHLLRLVVGASAISLGILLAVFMGGMCLGSLCYARVVSPRRHPLRVYAALELGIAGAGAALPLVLPHVATVYTSVTGHGGASVALRGVIAALCLLPPTMLMGATLPAIGRWVRSDPAGMSRIGWFYGFNTVGAFAGTALAGFLLLPRTDVVTASLLAALLNLVVAAGAILLSLSSRRCRPSEPDDLSVPHATPSIYAVIALSGLTALGAQVVWTRLLSLLFGVTIYAFTIILAVYLAGLGLGSGAGAALARRTAHPFRWLASTQLLLLLAIPFAGWLIADVLGFWEPIDTEHRREMVRVFLNDGVRCAAAVLPATFLWGASFPLALAAAAGPGREPGRLVGRIYASNTVGAILGALAFTFVMIPSLGTQRAQQGMVAIAALAAGIAAAKDPPPGHLRKLALPAIALVALAGLLLVPPTPVGLVAHGRHITAWRDWLEYPFVEEGVNASVAVRVEPDGVPYLHISGKVVASGLPLDMKLQRMLGHLPMAVAPDARSVLVVGMGTGSTAGAFVVHPGVESITVVEIESLVPRAAGLHFAEENHHLLEDPRFRLVHDDARHFLATTDESFDVISADPLHPWVRGATSLISREYFELCRRRLNPGGVVTQWVPLYETSAEVVRSVLATFFEVFPDGTAWRNNDEADQGYDLVLLGQAGPSSIDVDRLQAEIDGNAGLRDSLAWVGLDSAVSLLETYAGQGPELAPWLAGAEVHRDRSLRLEYQAGLALNASTAAAIYQAMAEHRAYPDDLFLAGETNRVALQQAFRPRPPRRRR